MEDALSNEMKAASQTAVQAKVAINRPRYRSAMKSCCGRKKNKSKKHGGPFLFYTREARK